MPTSRLPPRPCLYRNYNPDASSSPPTAPTLIYSLKSLEEQLKAAYKLVTEGKFTDALKVGGGVRGGASARLGAHWFCTLIARSPCSPLVTALSFSTSSSGRAVAKARQRHVQRALRLSAVTTVQLALHPCSPCTAGGSTVAAYLLYAAPAPLLRYTTASQVLFH